VVYTQNWFLLLVSIIYLHNANDWRGFLDDLAPETFMVYVYVLGLFGFFFFVFFYAVLVTGFVWRSHNPPLESSSFYDFPRMSKVSLLVIRDVDDEASFALTFGRIGARLNSILLMWMHQGSGAAFAIMIAFMCTFLFLAYTTPVAAKALSIAMILICVVGPLLSALFRATVGRELVFAGAGYEVAINSSPDTGEGNQTISRPPETSTVTLTALAGLRSLRHFIYEAESCTEVIALWLNRHRLRGMRAEMEEKKIADGGHRDNP
jgi:hypothetical protein